jgi:hypothetical protein
MSLTFAEWPVYDGDLDSFQNDWVEIDLGPTSSRSPEEFSRRPEFLSPTLAHFREREEHLQQGSILENLHFGRKLFE